MRSAVGAGPARIGEDRTDIPHVPRMSRAVEVEALTREHEHELDMVKLIEDPTQRWETVLLASTIYRRKPAAEQRDECSIDHANPRPSERSAGG